MTLKRSIILLSFVSFLIACGSANVNSAADEATLQAMMETKSFEIISQSASPQNTTAFNAVANSGLLMPGSSAGLISLIGNTNYLKVHGDTISGFLPFYGERRLGGSYGTQDVGIKFEGIPSDYEVKIGKKNVREIRFTIHDKEQRSEEYQIRINIYPNLSANINVNSSHRTSISYRGHASTSEK